MAEHFAGVGAGPSTSPSVHTRDRDTRDDAGWRSARSCCGGVDPRRDVFADRPLVGHPQDRAVGLFAGDPQHRGPERGQQHRHRGGVGDVDRTCAREKWSFSTSIWPGPASAASSTSR